MTRTIRILAIPVLQSVATKPPRHALHLYSLPTGFCWVDWTRQAIGLFQSSTRVGYP